MLNERHFGAVQEMTESEAVRLYGRRHVNHWCDDFCGLPPPVGFKDKRHLSKWQRD